MKSVGIRELKTKMGHYMKHVKAGERLVITDRKKEIGVIIPFQKEDQEEKIFDLIRNGKASWSGGKPKGMPNRIAIQGKSISDTVIEERR